MDDDCASVRSADSSDLKPNKDSSIDLTEESPGKSQSTENSEPPPTENVENSKLDTSAENEQIQRNRASPEPLCSICLGSLQDKCYTDSCSHTFCFTCLLEWSKIKAECPLCKVTFKSMVHNVRSNQDYDQYYVPSSPENTERCARFRRQTRALNIALLRLNPAFSSGIEQQRFTYAPHSMRGVPGVSSHTHAHSSTDTRFRKRVYSEGLWAKPFPSPARYTTPEYYQSSPACTHRLVPWLTRELQALLDDEQRVSFVLDFIMSIILRYDIQSEEFFLHTQSYLGGLTSQFVHEFYIFASSRYDIDEYDTHVVYRSLRPSKKFAPRIESEDIIFISSDESGDDDVRLEIPSTSPTRSWTRDPVTHKVYPPLCLLPPSGISPQSSPSRSPPNLCYSPLTYPEPCYSPSSVFANSPPSRWGDSPSPVPSSSASEKRIPKLSLKKNHKSNSWDVHISPVSPSSMSSLQNLNTSNFSSSTSTNNSYSLLAEAAKKFSTEKSPINITLSSDDSEVEIVAELKPKRLRTPEVVDLCSDVEKAAKPLEDLEPISDGSFTAEFSDNENSSMGNKSTKAQTLFEYLMEDNEDFKSHIASEKKRNKRKYSRHSTDHRHRHHSRKECHYKCNNQIKKKHSSDRRRKQSSSPLRNEYSSSSPGRKVRIRSSSSSSSSVGKGSVRYFKQVSEDVIHRKNNLYDEDESKLTPSHEISDNRNSPMGCISPISHSSSAATDILPLLPVHNSSSSDSHEHSHACSSEACKHRSYRSSRKTHRKNKKKHNKHKRKR